MKYAFFGTPKFAAIILDKLIEAKLSPSLVVCNPDKPAGRKKTITPPATKILAQENNIPILQPEILKVEDINDAGDFDFFLVVAFAHIIPKKIISIPRLGTIGIHPSLLPKYRGATPIQSTILNSDKKTGTTIYKIDEKMDHGPILAQTDVNLNQEDNYQSLSQKLATESANLIIKTLPDLINNKINPKTQNESKATYTKKFSIEDAFIEYKKIEEAEVGNNANEIHGKIKALNPEPGTWTTKNQKRIKLLDAKLENGKLKLTIIQKEGKNPTKVG